MQNTLDKIIVENLSFSYEKKEILHKISFELKQGDLLGLMGSNGSGKTTLIKSLMGFLKANYSRYLIFDKDTCKVRPCTYSDFVILMDRTTSFDTFKKVFDYLEIPCSVLKDENIINEDEIAIFKNYIRFVLRINS